MRTPLALLISFAWLAGCGFKGPLYLPARGSEAVKPAAPRPVTPSMPDEARPLPSDAVPAPK